MLYLDNMSAKLERDYMLKLDNTMQNTCGLAVDSMLLNIGYVAAFTHSYLDTQISTVYKQASYTYLYSQPVYFLCAVYRQVFCYFQSVKFGFVHIIHIAYKKDDYLKKGTI